MSNVSTLAWLSKKLNRVSENVPLASPPLFTYVDGYTTHEYASYQVYYCS